MPNIKKSTVLVAVVVLVTVFTYYRYTTKVLQAPKNEAAVPMAEPPVARAKEVSAVAEYVVPGDAVDRLRFTLVLDSEGKITSVKTEDAIKNEVNEHNQEFSDGLIVMIQGKKLSELSAVDRVGKSSLTTTAFNGVIDNLKSQL